MGKILGINGNPVGNDLSAAQRMANAAYEQGMQFAMTQLRYCRCPKHKDTPQRHAIPASPVSLLDTKGKEETTVHIVLAQPVAPGQTLPVGVPTTPECGACIEERALETLVKSREDIVKVCKFILSEVTTDEHGDPLGIFQSVARLLRAFDTPEESASK